jgi:hypothetical protein
MPNVDILFIVCFLALTVSIGYPMYHIIANSLTFLDKIGSKFVTTRVIVSTAILIASTIILLILVSKARHLIE